MCTCDATCHPSNYSLRRSNSLRSTLKKETNLSRLELLRFLYAHAVDCALWGHDGALFSFFRHKDLTRCHRCFGLCRTTWPPTISHLSDAAVKALSLYHAFLAVTERVRSLMACSVHPAFVCACFWPLSPGPSAQGYAEWRARITGTVLAPPRPFAH